jgi:hypothetical protein
LGPSREQIAERDARIEADHAARANNPNVALGFDPPPHRSALARRKKLPDAREVPRQSAAADF